MMKVEDSGLICKTKLKEAKIYIKNIEKLDDSFKDSKEVKRAYIKVKTFL